MTTRGRCDASFVRRSSSRLGWALGLGGLLALGACGQVLDTAPPDPALDASHGDSGGGGLDAGADASADATVDAGCRSDSDCANDLLCDGVEICIDGVCAAGEALDCSDSVSCTSDSCSETERGCVHVPDDTVCGGSDTNPKVCTVAEGCIRAERCTVRDECPEDNCAGAWVCRRGLCRNVGAPVEPVAECVETVCSPDDPASDTQGWLVTRHPSACDDSADCTADVCEVDGSCSHTDIESFCDDRWSCTADSCAPGADAGDDGCLHTPQDVLCTDTYTCTEDVCAPRAGGLELSGCVHNPVDVLCDDGIDCTTDTCTPRPDVDGGCTHRPVNTACDDSASCTDDYCNPALGLADSCVSVPRDRRCDAVVPFGTCIVPVCAPNASADVPGTGCASTWSGDLCRLGGVGGVSCDASGMCSPPRFPPSCTSGADCDDGNPCNGDEVCGPGGTCHQVTNGCDADLGSCLLPVCDMSGADPVCGARADPACFATAAGG